MFALNFESITKNMMYVCSKSRMFCTLLAPSREVQLMWVWYRFHALDTNYSIFWCKNSSCFVVLYHLGKFGPSDVACF